MRRTKSYTHYKFINKGYNYQMWFWYSLLASFLGAFSVILSKHALRNVSAAVLTWALFALSLPFLMVLTYREGIPSLSTFFFIGVAGSSIVFVFAKTIASHSIKHNFLSQIIPLSSFSTLFTYILGVFFLGETIHLIGVIGIFTIMIGAYMLNVESAKEHPLKPLKLLFTNSASFYYLLAMFLGSVTSIFDKLALQGTTPNAPLFPLLWENIIMTILLFFYLQKRENNWVKELKRNVLVLTANSVLYMFVTIFFFYSYLDGPVALVTAISQSRNIFVIALSYLFFKDRPQKNIWIGLLIMIIGIILIKVV